MDNFLDCLFRSWLHWWILILTILPWTTDLPPASPGVDQWSWSFTQALEWGLVHFVYWILSNTSVCLYCISFVDYCLQYTYKKDMVTFGDISTFWCLVLFCCEVFVEAHERALSQAHDNRRPETPQGLKLPQSMLQVGQWTTQIQSQTATSSFKDQWSWFTHSTIYFLVVYASSVKTLPAMQDVPVPLDDAELLDLPDSEMRRLLLPRNR